MQFRKISDTKIRCEISQEEMWEKGIEIDDFLDHREKTEEFIRDILAEAKYELDLDDMGHFFSVQMSVLPEGGVSLLISGEHHQEVGSALEEFGKRLQDFKEIMGEAKKQLEESKLSEQQKDAKTDASNKKADSDKTSGAVNKKQFLEIPIWARLKDLDTCIKMSKYVPIQHGLQSALYKYDEEYYMQLSFANADAQLAGVILAVSEYAIEIFPEDQGGQLLLEHGTPVCKEQAIETLAAL